MPETHSIAQEHSKRNESSEPEDHGDGFHGQYGEFVMCDGLGEPPWYDDEVDEGEDRPDRVEDQDVDLAGGDGVPVG